MSGPDVTRDQVVEAIEAVDQDIARHTAELIRCRALRESLTAQLGQELAEPYVSQSDTAAATTEGARQAQEWLDQIDLYGSSTPLGGTP